jgi:hypothetical protein
MAFSAEPASGEEKAEAEEESLHTTAAAGAGAGDGDGDGSEVSHEEWRRWGTSSPLPAAVAAVVRELLEMEAAAGEKMRFGGVGSKLKVTPSSSLFVLLNPSRFFLGAGGGVLEASVRAMQDRNSWQHYWLRGLILSGICRVISRTWRTRSTGLSTRRLATPIRSCSISRRGRLVAVCLGAEGICAIR